MVTINVKSIDKNAKFPTYAHPGDAGMDLYSRVMITLKPMERKKIPTGIQVAIPEGYAGFVQPKSGLAIDNGIALVNSPGLIDSGFRGEICAILINLDQKQDFIINKGDKICQLVIQKVEKAEIKTVSQLDNTSRGKGGFGSTGRF
ncbi:MAG: dUTP diphosphatase [Actinomycetota bacterium]|nr:dUTP diphosphatase [Actinomycetota bacterium]